MAYHGGFSANRIHRCFYFGRYGCLLPFPGMARPYVEASSPAWGDFPRAPNAFPFSKPPVIDIVGADIPLSPIALAIMGIITTPDKKAPDIVATVSRH